MGCTCARRARRLRGRARRTDTHAASLRRRMMRSTRRRRERLRSLLETMRLATSTAIAGESEARPMKSRREIPSAAASARSCASVSELASLASIEEESYSKAPLAQPEEPSRHVPMFRGRPSASCTDPSHFRRQGDDRPTESAAPACVSGTRAPCRKGVTCANPLIERRRPPCSRRGARSSSIDLLSTSAAAARRCRVEPRTAPVPSRRLTARVWSRPKRTTSSASSPSSYASSFP